ncbi:interleukin-1 beta [Aulostomus maculatus]
MQCVAMLVVAVNRMKQSLSRRGYELRDEQLCGQILDSIAKDATAHTGANNASQNPKVFHRSDSIRQCTVCDSTQRHIVCKSGTKKLQAILLKGGDDEHKVSFKMSRYVPSTWTYCQSQIVRLSIKDNLHISCSKQSHEPVLNVEECALDLSQIRSDGDLNRFLFYKRTQGKCLTTFESVNCSGWFISTSSMFENQTVEMCHKGATCRLTSFQINEA